MSNAYTLDDLKSDLDKEFAPLKLNVGGEDLVLQNILRIGEKDREVVMEALKEVEGANVDENDGKSIEDVQKLAGSLETILKTVTANGKGDKLIESFNGDMMLAMKVMELWSEATQPGEAQNSPA